MVLIFFEQKDNCEPILKREKKDAMLKIDIKTSLNIDPSITQSKINIGYGIGYSPLSGLNVTENQNTLNNYLKKGIINFEEYMSRKLDDVDTEKCIDVDRN